MIVILLKLIHLNSEEQSELSLAETLKQVRNNPKPKIGDDIKQICKDIKKKRLENIVNLCLITKSILLNV